MDNNFNEKSTLYKIKEIFTLDKIQLITTDEDNFLTNNTNENIKEENINILMRLIVDNNTIYNVYTKNKNEKDLWTQSLLQVLNSFLFGSPLGLKKSITFYI